MKTEVLKTHKYATVRVIKYLAISHRMFPLVQMVKKSTHTDT